MTTTTPYAVEVTGIAPETTDEHLHDFFAFCGSIASVNKKESTATVYFESPNAVKTAALLNGAVLDGAHLIIATEGEEHPDTHEEDGTHFVQSDKPRAGIVAEYLSRGYVLSDNILERAISFDKEKGISKRFLAHWQNVDTTVGQKALGPDKTVSGKVTETVSYATDRAKTFDEQKGISKSAWEYYTKALATPLGQRVKQFYTVADKQVRDIHEEARRIADDHKATSTQHPSSAAEQHGAALNNAAGKVDAPASVGGPVGTSTPTAPAA